jgi:hypothetical protein
MAYKAVEAATRLADQQLTLLKEIAEKKKKELVENERKGATK